MPHGVRLRRATKAAIGISLEVVSSVPSVKESTKKGRDEIALREGANTSKRKHDVANLVIEEILSRDARFGGIVGETTVEGGSGGADGIVDGEKDFVVVALKVFRQNARRLIVNKVEEVVVIGDSMLKRRTGRVKKTSWGEGESFVDDGVVVVEEGTKGRREEGSAKHGSLRS